MPDSAARVRLDKWLWAARFYRTRSLAAQAIDAGRVCAGELRVKPAHLLRPGDRVSVRKGPLHWMVEVTALSERRGNASEAATLYRENAESIAARAEEMARRKAAAVSAPNWPGRPTKRQRRKLQEFLEEG